jgi:putative transposase
MGLRFPQQIYGTGFFVTTSFRDRQKLGLVDGMYEALADSLIFYSDKYKARILGYVFMPSHIHLVLYIEDGNLSNFMRDLKKFVAQKAAKDLAIGKGSIWMPRYDRVVIFSENVLRTKLNYMHNNPVKAGLAVSPESWFWSSAGDYLRRGCSPIPVYIDWI